jgi:hypothetical protein
MGAAAAAATPENIEYLTLTQRPGWALLRVLQGRSEGAVAAALLPVPCVVAAG